MPSPILARADALMQRRRTSNTETDNVPVLTDSIEDEEDDDFPVLLDIETPAVWCENPTEPRVEISAQDDFDLPTLDTGLRDILAHELARRVEQRLIAQLPQIIESTVRDFLAEQEMIAKLQPRE